MPPVRIKNFDALIYNKLFFIQPVKNRQEAYEKLQMSKNNDCLTGNLLNYSHHQIKASHIKSFAHGQPPASQKHFLILCMNFDYCLQTEEKNKNNKKAFNCDNFYFLVIDCLDSQLNHIIVSMFVLESRQV